MRIIWTGPDKGNVKEMEINDDLRTLQNLVDGYIEVAHIPGLSEEGILLICNETGLLDGLTPNKNLEPFFYVGSCFFVGLGEEEFVSLTDHQVELVKEFLKSCGGYNDVS